MGSHADQSAQLAQDIRIVRTVDDFMKVTVVRAIVYVGSQQCPYDEEFDGNDFCGMHLLGTVGGEAAACLRIRFFAEFAKIERLAVRPEYRRSSIAFAIVRRAIRIIAQKGYVRIYGHAQQGLESFWSRFGSRPMGPKASFSFSGHRYTEMLLDLSHQDDAIRLGDDPLVINRPEGEWDTPGILEQWNIVGRSADKDTGAQSTPDQISPDNQSWSDHMREAWCAWAYGSAHDAPPRL